MEQDFDEIAVCVVLDKSRKNKILLLCFTNFRLLTFLHRSAKDTIIREVFLVVVVVKQQQSHDSDQKENCSSKLQDQIPIFWFKNEF